MPGDSPRLTASELEARRTQEERDRVEPKRLY